jgi:hypothetical protein
MVFKFVFGEMHNLARLISIIIQRRVSKRQCLRDLGKFHRLGCSAGRYPKLRLLRQFFVSVATSTRGPLLARQQTFAI